MRDVAQSPKVNRAVNAVRSHGFAVLENALDQDVVEAAREMSAAVLKRKNRLRAALPSELLHRSPYTEIAANPWMIDVLAEIFDGASAPEGFRWLRCCPPGGSAIARVHRDTGAKKGPGGGPPLIEISVDVMLTDFT